MPIYKISLDTKKDRVSSISLSIMDGLLNMLRPSTSNEKKPLVVDMTPKIVDVTSDQPSFSSTHSTQCTDESQRTTTEKLLDRENRAVAQLLTRFKNIIDLAPEPKPASQTTAAIQSYQMEVETAALVCTSVIKRYLWLLCG